MGLSTFALTAILLSSGGSDPVMLEFSAPWCEPCRIVEPTVDRLIEQGYPIEKINFDQRPDLVERYGVSLIPCFVTVSQGRVVDRFVGAASEQQLRDMLASAGASPAQRSASINAHPPRTGNPAWRSPALPPTADAMTASDSVRPSPLPGGLSEEGRLERSLLAATARLRVEAAANTFDIGTGTVIDYREENQIATILTCAHVFLDEADRRSGRTEAEDLRHKRIEVEVFDRNPPRKTAGHLLSCNDERDVALVQIRLDGPISAIPVAPQDHDVKIGDPIMNVGCNHGDDPTLRHNEITAINRFEGAPNIEAGGEPELGRSGGGLFSADGYLIGVCNLANPSDREGIYAPLQSIHGELARAELAHLYQHDGQARLDASGELVGMPHLPRDMPGIEASQPMGPAPGVIPNPVQPASGMIPIGSPASSVAAIAAHSLDLRGLTPQQIATLEQVHRMMAEGADVVCLVRPDGTSAGGGGTILVERPTEPQPTRPASYGSATQPISRPGGMHENTNGRRSDNFSFTHPAPRR